MTTLLPYEERPDPGPRITEVPGLCVLSLSPPCLKVLDLACWGRPPRPAPCTEADLSQVLEPPPFPR